jgi:large subunit ribosomal protein L35
VAVVCARAHPANVDAGFAFGRANPSALSGRPTATRLKARTRAHFEHMRVNRASARVFRPDQESQMPKIKTKSGAKKRFKITGTGKVLFAQSRKRHGMIKRTKKQIRQLRGTSVLFKTDGDNVKKYWLPNG